MDNKVFRWFLSDFAIFVAADHSYKLRASDCPAFSDIVRRERPGFSILESDDKQDKVGREGS